MEQKQYDVFISYSRKDYKDDKDNVIPGNVVSKIKDVLTNAGIAFWFDENGIHHGDDFAEKIVLNIEASDIFVFLSTENSNSSLWTRKEIACANELNKKIIPVRIDDSKYDKAVMLRISDLDYIDYAKNPENGLQELLKEINHSVQIKKDAEKKKKEEIEKLGLQKKIKQQKEIEEIESLIKQLEAEELTAEISRKDLILRAQRIDDEEQKDRLLLLIENCGAISLKIRDKDNLISDLEQKNKKMKIELQSNSISNIVTLKHYKKHIIVVSIIFILFGFTVGRLPFFKQSNYHKYVDLGLPSGVKWAKSNIGSNSPKTDHGMSFYWDEMMEKIEKDGSLIYKDKVSTFWGKDWRLPSKTEFEELLVCCVWTPKIRSLYEKYYKVTGPNGNSIYFYADRDVSLMSSTGPSCCLILGEPDYAGSGSINIVSNNDRKCYIRPITE